MFKRKQQDVSDGSKHWYQDKYQHVLTQRNILALVALCANIAAIVAVFALMRLAPLKTVEPYLLQMDEKTGITQRVIPITRRDYTANEGVDRYFTAQYLRVRESYNVNILRYNYNIVRLMSTEPIFNVFRRFSNPDNEEGFVKRLGALGQRDIRIRSMVYITNPVDAKGRTGTPPNTKIIQARVTALESMPNKAPEESMWIITITFEYADLDLNVDDQLLNPLGYTVTSYQIQPETTP
jgi:type IV secretion system protein VirB8